MNFRRISILSIVGALLTEAAAACRFGRGDSRRNSSGAMSTQWSPTEWLLCSRLDHARFQGAGGRQGPDHHQLLLSVAPGLAAEPGAALPGSVLRRFRDGSVKSTDRSPGRRVIYRCQCGAEPVNGYCELRRHLADRSKLHGRCGPFAGRGEQHPCVLVEHQSWSWRETLAGANRSWCCEAWPRLWRPFAGARPSS
jgi:hypothetical protein